jgi:hypothetical protein
MNRYQPSTPRVALGIAALALTSLTMALALIVPASMSPLAPEMGAVRTARAPAPRPTEVVIIPARIDVIGVRKSKIAGVPPAEVPATDRGQG